MILKNVTVKNWGLHAAFAVELSDKAPLVVLCGDNEVGKSLMGLAVDFGLRGTMSRIGKDRKGFIKTGAKNGQVAINVGAGGEDDAHLVRDIATGKHTHATANFAELAGNPVLWPMVSSIFAWSDMTADERRKVLFSAFSLPEGVAACESTLRAEKFSEGMIKQITAFPSYEVALKHCETKAAEARGAWKNITGETYGDVKGVDWSPANCPVAIPNDSADRLANMRAELQSLNQNIQKEKTIIDQHQGSAAALKSLNDNFNKAATAASAMLEKIGIDAAGVKPYIEKTMRPFVENLRQVHAQAKAQYDEQKQLADQLRAGVRIKPSVETCPCCQAELIRTMQGLQEYIEPETAATTLEETTAAYNQQVSLQPGVDDALTRFNSANQKLEILLQLANAYSALEAVNDANSANSPNADLMNELITQRDALAADIKSLAETIDNYTNGQKKTTQAKIEHDLVQVWTLMAQWMKPSGCQSLMLSSVLQPVNDRLNTNCQRLGWPPVVLNDDMSITYKSLPYAAASKSGQWRASVVITEAVLHLGGCQSMVIDELDLLAIKSRPAFLKWIHTLNKLGELKRAIIIGTLESAPKLPAPYNVVWINAS